MADGSDELVSWLLHKLRQPLTGLMTQADVLAMRLNRRELASEARSAEALRLAALRLGAILDDVQDMSDPEGLARRLRRSPTDLVALVDAVVAQVDFRGDARGRLRRVDAAPALEAPLDADLVARAVAHLVSNALRYADPRGAIEIRTERASGCAVIAVADDGPGIAATGLPGLFERNGGRPSRSGSGLGLYVTRLIAEAHGGRVEAESDLGSGSVFRLVLPLPAETSG